VLTGSHQLRLREAVALSLAGRTSILHLLPLSIRELRAAGFGFKQFEGYLLHGFSPRVYDQQQRPRVAYASSYQRYVERDVLQLIQLKDATLFAEVRCQARCSDDPNVALLLEERAWHRTHDMRLLKPDRT